MQHFKGPVAHVAGGDIHVHQYWPESQPPDDPELAVQCWQCRRPTWRYTRCCVHCQVVLRRSLVERLAMKLGAVLGA
ncbi:hypothetical protein MASR1M6_00190 [Rubrivivax sp.]